MSVLSPSARVPVGRPHALYTSYKLTFGGALVVGKTLDEISREQPWFIAWVCGKVRSENRFVMRFPAHEMLYLGLLELEQNAKKLVWEEGVERVSWTIKLSPDLKRNFEAHFIGAPDERRQNAEAYEERALAEEREDDADADPFVDGINRTANRVGEPTLAFLKSVDTSAFEQWNNMEVRPKDWSVVEPFSAAAAQVLPVVFWNPSFWKRIGVEGCPCKVYGWAHERHVRVRGWRPRAGRRGTHGQHRPLVGLGRRRALRRRPREQPPARLHPAAVPRVGAHRNALRPALEVGRAVRRARAPG
ncbi:hypothetical protein M885DRAFT_249233 [Pelagophyceae sp. CCMP2097]|nr:hypothetical protein M885DRAFT_249233 [Pelagophyceae sp. CCMP2097]